MAIDLRTADFRGLPTFACLCGGNTFKILAVFDEETRLPGWYSLTGFCAACGAAVTVPCPVDKECET
jgi:hypothetical protein